MANSAFGMSDADSPMLGKTSVVRGPPLVNHISQFTSAGQASSRRNIRETRRDPSFRVQSHLLAKEMDWSVNIRSQNFIEACKEWEEEEEKAEGDDDR